MPEQATVASMQRLIAQVREQSPSQIVVDRDTRFVTDLGLASLELIALVFLCEQTFAVQLVSQPGLLARLHTIGVAIDAIGDLQRAAEPAHA
ncbi:MAG: hypothetical protein WDO68_02125 [Gammaproteobacteria bacterium]